ncbi:MAG: undecaprenyl-diphosphate phosphatase [Candidatus Omnitrophica bacterium]|nr:undecaprenyl-diphosphate phosphatase [Candidatus Omnitrophota bacterium]MDD5592219.1 undecaprenyl-diphosphate phosphatase [Candidatus Omnitrophota bacterium]
MLSYIILGIIQGITEFFPVSSSAHLVIAQKLLGVNEQALVVSVVLHLGTCVALIIFFFKDILNLLRNFKLLSYIIIVTLITGIIGISGKDFFEKLFGSPVLVALALIVTGAILIFTKKFIRAKRNSPNIKDALTLGLTQGIAIIPGISRSGITISTLLFRGVDRETSFRFSFLASIPAVFGAAILELKDISLCGNLGAGNLAIGFVFSLLTGILSLKILKMILGKAKLYYFGYYCIIIAVVTLLFIK